MLLIRGVIRDKVSRAEYLVDLDDTELFALVGVIANAANFWAFQHDTLIIILIGSQQGQTMNLWGFELFSTDAPEDGQLLPIRYPDHHQSDQLPNSVVLEMTVQVGGVVKVDIFVTSSVLKVIGRAATHFEYLQILRLETLGSDVQTRFDLQREEARIFDCDDLAKVEVGVEEPGQIGQTESFGQRCDCGRRFPLMPACFGRLDQPR